MEKLCYVVVKVVVKSVNDYSNDRPYWLVAKTDGGTIVASAAAIAEMMRDAEDYLLTAYAPQIFATALPDSYWDAGWALAAVDWRSGAVVPRYALDTVDGFHFFHGINYEGKESDGVIITPQNFRLYTDKPTELVGRLNKVFKSGGSFSESFREEIADGVAYFNSRV